MCNTAPASQGTLPGKHSVKNIFYRKETVNREANTADLFDCFIADHEKLTGKRIHDRARLDQLCNVFDISEIVVNIANGDVCHNGWLHDISSGGAAVRVSPFTARSDDFHLTFFLGIRLISVQAKVKNVSTRGGAHILGFKFVDIANDCKEYLQGSIYITKLLHEKSML